MYEIAAEKNLTYCKKEEASKKSEHFPFLVVKYKT